MLRVYLILLAIAIGTLAQEYRLPKVVVPDSYDIAIKPYLRDDDGAKQFTFDGEVIITLHAIAIGVSSIALHKDYLDILETALYDADDKLIEHIDNTRLMYDTITDVLTVHLKAQLVAHLNYRLNFKYTGQIRSGLAGVFRGSYTNTSWYAVTQLQRIDARTAFPCFDEPEFKSKFRMRISRNKEFKSYFNSRLLSSAEDGEDRFVDTFEETPPMSTYLVAFLVGEFMEHGDSDYKLIMHSQFSNKTDFAYDVGKKVLQSYDNYTGIPYKTLGNGIMQKAVVGRFPHNGMENWGLVIYRDSVLVHEPGYTDGWSNKEYTITILVHETAHMWFGNSVTFKWWSYFWLNEAFARYYQYFMAHEMFPEFELDKQFIVNQIHLIFGTDATNTTQAMTSPEASIQSPSEIAYKFSGIAYAKGASIVRMICNLMGKENFDNSIREYLRENHLGNTEPNDLFVYWKRHWPTGHNVYLTQFLSDWTEQVGFPMLMIRITPTGEYSLNQQRFLLDSTDGSDPSLRYTVPITFTTARENNFDDLSPKFYLNKTVEEIKFGNANADDWIVLNLQQSNYHRVFYDTHLLKRIHKALVTSNHSGIHVLNRAHIVDDLFTYGHIGLMGYDEVFEFMEYLASETEYLAWHPAFSGLQIIYQRLTLDQHRELGNFLFEILASVYKKLGFSQENDTVLDVYHRNYVISWLCKYHHQDCNLEAQRLFRAYVKANTKPLPDFRETLYCAACRDATFDIYNSLSIFFVNETIASEREKLLRAMGCTMNFVEFHYEFILTIKVPQDLKATAIRSMYTQTPENVMPVFRSITDTVENLAKVLDSWTETASVIIDIAGYFTSEEQLDGLKNFIDSKGHLFGTSVSTLQIAVETVEQNLEWSEKRLGKLFSYLGQRNGSTSSGVPASAVTILIVVALLGMFR